MTGINGVLFDLVALAVATCMVTAKSALRFCSITVFDV